MSSNTRGRLERLQELGLSPSGARVYLALLEHGPQTAPNIAEVTDVPRSSAYPVLQSLVDKGMVEGGAGYGSRFRARPPGEGLLRLVEEAREAVLERERVAKLLEDDLSLLAERANTEHEEIVEVLRHPRVIGERLDRFARAARQEILTLVKAPVITTWAQAPSDEIPLPARGGRDRAIYERAVLTHPQAAASLRVGLQAGEEARIYPDDLPMKMALFDGHVAVMPLVVENDSQPTTLIVRNSALGTSLRMLFERLWESSEELP